ncbi:MAG: phosphopantothenoylcysteine decarboxylase [Phycisphaerales bacterium]
MPQTQLLITAGPTHEPIDEVRYLANRSSGRLGVAIADAAARRGWRVTMLLGPTHLSVSDTNVDLHRFRTAADLEALLREHAPHCDLLIMAAAVADYRPAARSAGKIERTDQALTVTLEPVPDLIAACARAKRPHQRFVGFALAAREGLEAAARAKMARKGLDGIVANPLETMDAETVEAILIAGEAVARTQGPVSKAAFAEWLLDRLESP